MWESHPGEGGWTDGLRCRGSLVEIVGISKHDNRKLNSMDRYFCLLGGGLLPDVTKDNVLGCLIHSIKGP